MQLYIGNKNYSSWSLRAWLLMTQSGIAFEEVKLRLDSRAGSEFKQRLAAVTPAGRVPVLVDEDGFAVWDSLAIGEYLAERFPSLHLWPQDRCARARARSVCAEMHAGFTALRTHCGMNIEASLPEVGRRVLAERPEVAADLARIDALWTDALRAHGGPFLFGTFSIADAFFAPVCLRLQTYALPVSAAAQGYVAHILALPAMKRWIADALAEHDFVDEDEPYRKRP